MIKVKFDDGTTKVYRNDDTVKLNQHMYIGAYDLKIGYKAGNKKIVDIERFSQTLRFLSNLAKCCVWFLFVYIAVVLAVV